MTWLHGLEHICQFDVPLARHTWYRLGGPARWFFTPRSQDELARLLDRCTTHQIPWRMLGRGANLLVRDCGFDGAVIRLAGPFWNAVRFDPPLLHAAAGIDLPRLVKQTIQRGLSGLETLAGIPGTLGGAVRMNAGGRHGCLAQFVKQVHLLDLAAQPQTRAPEQMHFTYRGCRLDGCVVTGLTLELPDGDPPTLMARFKQILDDRRRTQPPLSARTAGCIFKNPPGQAAGRLIDLAGLKGRRCGQAEVSTRHANFIIAHPGATTQDVLDLISLVRERVRSQTGIELELEVEIW